MTFTQRMVARPVTVLMIFLIVVGVGALMLQRLAVDLFPEIDPPVMAITTSYQANPEEVEENVTKPVESAVANVSGLDALSSTSSQGSSFILLEFEWGVDMNQAADDIRDAVERVSGALPDGAADPQILRFDPNSQPIMTVALSGERSAEELRVIAEEDLQSTLERVPGVGQANISGGREEVVTVELDAAAIEAYRLTVSGIANSLAGASSDLSGGSIAIDGRKLFLRATSEFESLESIESVVVGSVGQGAEGRPVRLEEVGDVSFTFEEADSYVYVNGESSVRISLVPESSANTVQVAEAIHATLEELRGELPEGVTLTTTNDQSTIISDTLDQVTSALLTGALLAMAVLLFFLHNIRAALVIGISIPVSILATFLAMGAGGVTLNLLSMSGLVLGIGMIVDSSIVVLENIERHRREGYEIKQAATIGTQEMITPITASALTTVSVFLPLLIFSDELGIIGILLNDISFVIIVAIIGSLAVAALLVPVLASTYIPLGGAGTAHRGPFAAIGRFIEAGLRGVDAGYAWLLERALRYRAIVLSAAFSILVVSLSLAPSLGIIFAPPTPASNVSVNIELREGTELAETDRVANELAADIMHEFPEVPTVVVNAGGGGGPFGGGGSNSASINVTLASIQERTVTQDDVRTFARKEVDRMAGVSLSFGGGGQGLGAGEPVDIVVQSDDLDALNRVASDVRELIERSFPMVTEPSLDIGDPSPQLVVSVDHHRAADLGVQPSAVVREVRNAFAGTTAAQYSRAGEEWDVVVRLSEEQRSDISDIESLFVVSSRGTPVPVANVAEVSFSETPTEIQREEQIRTIHVTGGLAPGNIASEIQPQVVTAIEENIDVPEHVSVEFSGELSSIQETTGQIGLVFLLALFLVFAIMASQFESFRMPFIIFFTIPLMLVGVVLIHLIMDQPVSMFSLIGLVVLAGIVVNNAIVLVDYTNLLRARGRELFDAAIASARTRLRPILMTTFTTILGMAPLAFFPGEGAELTQPVGITVVGGLASSAIMTLFVVPVLYTMFASKKGVRKSDAVAELE